MIANQGKLQEAVLQAMREVNDACFALRQEGIVVLLPEFIDFEVDMVTGNDINAVSRSVVESESNGGATVTLREQLGSDQETSSRNSSQTVSQTNSQTTTETNDQTTSENTNGTSSENSSGNTNETTNQTTTITNNETNTETISNTVTENDSGSTVTTKVPAPITETVTTTHPGMTTVQGGADKEVSDTFYTYTSDG
jgi:hypothetical protein